MLMEYPNHEACTFPCYFRILCRRSLKYDNNMEDVTPCFISSHDDMNNTDVDVQNQHANIVTDDLVSATSTSPLSP